MQLPSTVSGTDFSNVHIGHAARLSFVFLGIAVAMWGALIPYIKLQLKVNEGTLGLLLLCVGFGGLVSMLLSASLAARFGCKRLLQLCIPADFLITVAILFVEDVWFAALIFTLKGMSTGIVDVVINIQALFIEKGCARKLLSHMHAMYSLGCIVGALAMAAMLSMGFSPLQAVSLLSLLACLCTWLYCQRFFLTYGSDAAETSHTPLFVCPKGIVFIIGILCFLLYMNEGIVLDWAALFLTQERGVPIAQATFAFAIFSITMTIGRLCGDALTEKYGVQKMLILSAGLAALGHVLVLCSHGRSLAFMGFALVGLGSSNLVPQFFAFSARQKTMPTHMALAAITMLGYLGLLVGPAMMGFVAETFNLTTVFGLTAVFLLVVGCAVPFIVRRLEK